MSIINSNRWLIDIVSKQKFRIVAYFLLELGGIAASLLLVYYSKLAIDNAMANKDSIIKILSWVVTFGILGLLFRVFSQWFNQRVQLDLFTEIQRTLTKNQLLSVWSVIKKWHTGDILVRINSDTQEVVQMLSTTWLSFVLTIIKLLAAFGFLYFMDPMLAIVILLTTPLFLFAKMYFKRLRVLSKQVKDAESNIGTIIQESLRFRTLVRSLGLVEYRQAKLDEGQKEFVKLKLKHLNFSLITQGAMRLAMTSGYIIAFVWGVYKLRSQEITFGTMTAFLQLVSQVQSPILALVSFFPAFVRFRVSLERLGEIESQEKDIIAHPILFNEVTEIRANNINFKYEDEPIIRDLNFSLRKGESLAIVGASGTGKTTLIRLLLMLLKPDKGEITISGDQQPLTTLKNGHRINFSYVPQGNSLFSGSIRENLTLDNSNIDVEEALDIACADFVNSLPNGLDTRIGESGFGLSEGQAQRLAIARAILADKNIWLLDEPTSALDATTSSVFMDKLLHAAKNKIIIFVTHDLALAQKCTKSIMMN